MSHLIVKLIKIFLSIYCPMRDECPYRVMDVLGVDRKLLRKYIDEGGKLVFDFASEHLAEFNKELNCGLKNEEFKQFVLEAQELLNKFNIASIFTENNEEENGKKEVHKKGKARRYNARN